jgi:membrane protein YdbS with pleckstrin-like domain
LETDPSIIAEEIAVSTDYVDTHQPGVSRFGVEISEQFHPLDPRNVRLEQIASLISSTVLLTGIMIALLIVWINVGSGLLWYGLAGGAALVVTLLFVAAWFWPPLAHRYASWRLDAEGLEIRRGVLWRHQITIPLGRVQHADVSQGPFQRMFELGTLTVHTAGTQNASVDLQGLTHAMAISLRDLIVQQRKDQHVV